VVARTALSGCKNAPRHCKAIFETAELVLYSWTTSRGFGHGDTAASAKRKCLNPTVACNKGA